MKLSKVMLKCLIDCTCKRGDRPTLEGVLVDFYNRRMVASNGKIMMIIDGIDGMEGAGIGNDSSLIMPRGVVEQVIRENPKGGIIIGCDHVNGIPYKAVDGEYPDWERVLPDGFDERIEDRYRGKRYPFRLFNWRYMKVVENIGKAFGGLEYKSFDGKLYGEGRNVRVLLMGMNL